MAADDVEMDLIAPYRHRQRLRAIKLNRRLVHQTTVSPGPDGRPGEVLMTSSVNLRSGKIAIDGSRSDLQTWLSTRGSSLLAVCLGSLADHGTPLESAQKSIWEWDRRRIGSCIEGPTPSSMAGCDAITYRLGRANGETLREWKFEREGWLFVAGILLKPDDAPWAESLGLQSLASWRWLPGTTTSIVPPTPEREVVEVTESAFVGADPPTVWALTRHVENNRLLHDNLVDAFKVPGTPTGVGEEQSLVLQFPNARITFTSVIVDESPPHRLVARTHGVNDEFDRQTYSFDAVDGGTRLTITFRFSVNARREVASEQVRETTASIRSYLARVSAVIASGWRDDRPTMCEGI